MEGTQLGNYELIARLGMGGMAEVYLARRNGPAGFTKYVAIKRMRSDLTAHQEFVDLFAEEANTASLLTHPNICQVYEFNAEGGEYYMVMEYLEGVPVSSVMIKSLRRKAWPPLPITLAILEQACDGVHYAHNSTDEDGNPLHLVHRDISPPNLLVTSTGVVKLLDFGISKSKQSVVQTMTGQIRGKFSYMSPEQLQSKTLDRRSDVFSLGIVLHELVTGKRLFRRESRLQVYHAITSEPIDEPSKERADLPRELEAVMMRALARDRGDRFSSARDMADALRRAAETVGGIASNVELSEFVAKNFSAELDSKRDLFTDPASAVMREVTHHSLTNPTVSLRRPENIPTEADATVPGYIPTHANTVTVEFEDSDGDSALPPEPLEQSASGSATKDLVAAPTGSGPGIDDALTDEALTEHSVDLPPETMLDVPAAGKALDLPKATDPSTGQITSSPTPTPGGEPVGE